MGGDIFLILKFDDQMFRVADRMFWQSDDNFQPGFTPNKPQIHTDITNPRISPEPEGVVQASNSLG